MTRIKCVSESTITGPNTCATLFDKYRNKRVEHFLVATLNGAHKPIHTYLVSMGTVNRTLVSPREVFWFAIKDMAVSIIVCHNHPSGEVNPSAEDLEITKRLAEAGELLNINLLDHVIISKKAHYSFQENNLI